MNIITEVYKGMLSYFNYPDISEKTLKDIRGPLLLHISDTPVDIYRYIFRIIDILKPQFIIHTGDMVDNIKLEIHKDKIDLYYKGVKKLIEGLEKNEFSKIYYTLGNHDDYDIVSKLTKRGIILEESFLAINHCIITADHYYKEYSYKVDFNLYGHSFEPRHYSKGGTIGLNGLLNINVIDLSTKGVFHLEYPMGTNSSRGMALKRIGL